MAQLHITLNLEELTEAVMNSDVNAEENTLKMSSWQQNSPRSLEALSDGEA